MNSTTPDKTSIQMGFRLISSQFITFLYAPVIAFFFFVGIPALFLYAANLFTSQHNTELPIVSISVALLYLFITPTSLCTGIIYSIFTIYRKKPLSWMITTLIYALLSALWCGILTFKLTGHLPTLQVLFSNNTFISYEVIWSACLFVLLFAIASLGFFPIAILSRTMKTTPQRRGLHLVLLTASILILFCGFVYKTNWLPAIQTFFQ